jgi:hypothetical protein
VFGLKQSKTLQSSLTLPSPRWGEEKIGKSSPLDGNPGFALVMTWSDCFGSLAMTLQYSFEQRRAKELLGLTLKIKKAIWIIRA